MIRGIRFEIPNQYGHFLGDVLKPIDMTEYQWKIGQGESYLIINDQLDKDLLKGDVIEGTELKKLIDYNRSYLIFVDLQAFPKGQISPIETYQEFKESPCELVLLVVDTSYVTIYCKNQEAIKLLYENALEHQFDKIEYVTDKNDSNTSIVAW
ncbi:DUF2691 family protein [Robertmurraya massiliosenegalensis]|uniref:DUF2691 family protein n=1 Tax=Robertmurraya TaxID=2837507 RepID=UPI0039A731C2